MKTKKKISKKVKSKKKVTLKKISLYCGYDGVPNIDYDTNLEKLFGSEVVKSFWDDDTKYRELVFLIPPRKYGKIKEEVSKVFGNIVSIYEKN